MDSGFIENNCVNLIGSVVTKPKFNHEYHDEKFYVIDLNIKRLSDSFDTVPVIVSERLIDIKSLSPERKVSVVGQYRSYNALRQGGMRKLLLLVFAKEISVVEDIDAYADVNPNEIYLNGFVCKDPSYRKTPFGREICDLLIAINRQYSKSDYIPCICWGRNAKYAQGFLRGSEVKIWGRIQSRTYQKRHADSTTTEHVAYEVSVTKVLQEKNESDMSDDIL